MHSIALHKGQNCLGDNGAVVTTKAASPVPPQLCHMLGTVTRLQPTWIRGCAVPGGVPALPGGGTGLSLCRAAIQRGWRCWEQAERGAGEGSGLETALLGHQWGQPCTKPSGPVLPRCVPLSRCFFLLEGDPASGVGCYPSALHARPHALPSFPSLLGSCAIGVVRFGRALLGPAAPPSHPLCLFIFAAMAEDGGAASDSPQVRATGRVLGVQTGGGDTGEPPCSMYQGVPPG